MKKVAYISTITGFIPRLQLQARTLQKEGYEVMLIGWDRKHNQPEQETINGVRFVRTPPYLSVANPKGSVTQAQTTMWGVPGQRGMKMLLKAPMLYNYFYKELLKADPDIIHCTHAALLPVAVLVGMLKGKKLVYEASDFYISQSLKRLPSGLKLVKRLAIFMEGLLVRRLDAVFCIPSPGRKLFNTYSRNNPVVRELCNVPTLESNIDKELCARLKERYKNRKVVVYAGNINNKKGVLSVVKAVRLVRATHPEVRLVLIGSARGDDTGSVEEYVRANGLKDNVEVISLQPYKKLFTFYSVSQIGLLLVEKDYANKLTKGTSRKLIEYMKASLPIVGTKDGEAGLLVTDESCGLLVNVWDEQETAGAIKRLLDNPVEAAEMGRRGRRAVEDTYNWEKEKVHFLEVYRGL